MPSSVRVAVAVACLLACLGAASAAVWIAQAAGATRWLTSALDLDAATLGSAGSPLYLAALAVVPIALRRDGRKARVAFQLALLATITLGVMTLGLVGTALSARRLDRDLAAMLLVWALVGLLAAALSRPSARAWFGGGPAR